jgi:hypothetical protein
MGRQGHHCWNRPYNVITPLCAPHPQGQKKAGEEKHGDGVPVRPEDRETNVTW